MRKDYRGREGNDGRYERNRENKKGEKEKN